MGLDASVLVANNLVATVAGSEQEGGRSLRYLPAPPPPQRLPPTSVAGIIEPSMFFLVSIHGQGQGPWLQQARTDSVISTHGPGVANKQDNQPKTNRQSTTASAANLHFYLQCCSGVILIPWSLLSGLVDLHLPRGPARVGPGRATGSNSHSRCEWALCIGSR